MNTTANNLAWIAYEARDMAYATGPYDHAVSAETTDTVNSDNGGDDSTNPDRAFTFSFPLTFGCQMNAVGYAELGLASGVVGLDRRAESFWGQMRATSVIQRAMFSLCFASSATTLGTTWTTGEEEEDETTTTSMMMGGGVVVLGGVETRLHKTPMVFAQGTGDGESSTFEVMIRKMYLREGSTADASVMFNEKSRYHPIDVGLSAIIDSGTPDTYLVESISNEFRKLWLQVTKREYTNDLIDMLESDIARLPTIVLQMIPHHGGVGDEVQVTDPREIPGLAGNVDFSMPNDVMVAMPPRHYMRREGEGKYTSRIFLDRSERMGNLLGANVMMGHDVTFDMEDARIGFSESDCSYSRFVYVAPVSEDGDVVGVSPNNNNDQSSTEMMGGVDVVDENEICESYRCRFFFGITIAIIFIAFFLFGRRYVIRHDAREVIVNNIPPELEMTIEDTKSSRRRPPYSDSNGNEDVIDTRIGRVKRHPDYVNSHSSLSSHISDLSREQR
jgi:hypothetical protein